MRVIQQEVNSCLDCPCRVDGGCVEDRCSLTNSEISYDEDVFPDDCPLEEVDE